MLFARSSPRFERTIFGGGDEQGGNMNKQTLRGWEKEFDEYFGGTYFYGESGYDSPPQDGKGNIITTDRGIREYVKTSEIKDFISSLLKIQRSLMLQEMKGIIGEDDYIELPERPVNKQLNYVNMVRNKFREEQRKKLSEILENIKTYEKDNIL